MKNTGTKDMPVGFGWQPHLALPMSDRANVLLTVPSNVVLQKDRGTGLPTGQTAMTAGMPADFVHARGTKLGTASLNETYVSLQSGFMGGNPLAEVREPSMNYGLRVIPMTANFSNIRVVAPPDKPWISIGPATNVDDPLNHVWADRPELGLQPLKPGASVTWKVRLELFSLTGGGSEQPPS
jgi:aldose 1-epimerase